ncbi:thiosulfate/3-mercaptopyruvate sulfurtransferase [Geomicrobium halophilum]|uniref:Thiosulfate/3-mercaptopyruvate sulfurtransferase n=1 Tax=Geomicrobium halophilum TaxID=549000 RepID=A0A841PQP2_9BACL|nr:sulfurtransferase [Geomicrobium halophilum]MBB6451197.1 thiosulfate/3-mercaptopyruvate sulfurtransferase [Geomicrobium halophilum]
MNGEYIVTKEWLYEHLNDSDIVVADCRFQLSDPGAGWEAYRKDHIPGAVYFDLKKDLSGSASTHGGRHPLPAIEDFISVLNAAGIHQDKYVVVYDDQHGSMAGRLWWLLTYVGHEQVLLLDENYSEWKRQEYPVSTEIPQPVQTNFTPQLQPDMRVDMDEVKTLKEQDDIAVLDARAPERFSGEIEPTEERAGHIPGAENWFWKGNVSTVGKWKTTDELKERFRSLQDKEAVIVYCGSGVSANSNIIALKQAGFENVKLYPGSWSDWSSYDDNPIAKGKE